MGQCWLDSSEEDSAITISVSLCLLREPATRAESGRIGSKVRESWSAMGLPIRDSVSEGCRTGKGRR